MPKLSIITVNYNNGDGLLSTIRSVIDQTCSDFEYIVIDGGSTDDSPKIIADYSEKINYWISERDSGIYNAMNKGLEQSKGEYVLFLNSGDTLLENSVIEKAIPFLHANDIIYGSLISFNKEKSQGVSSPAVLTFLYLTEHSLPHPATFIKKELFEKFGFYDEELKICSDWKFFINAICRHKCSYKKIDLVISRFNEFGISNSPAHQSTVKSEMLKVITIELGDILYKEYQNQSILMAHVRSSRLIALLKKIGLLSNIHLQN